MIHNRKLLMSLFLFAMVNLPMNIFGQWEIPDDFIPLFNGRDFTGWNIEPDSGGWYVKDSRIICSGKPVPPYLILTEKEYENFELYVDFKMSERCNSGIFIHQLPRGWARESRVGMEIQITDHAGRAVGRGSAGSIYDAVAPLSNPVKPAGHWNRYYILMDWPVLKIWLNGQLVQDANLEDDEITRYRLRKGFIGLQNHIGGGSKVSSIEFRNLYIKELPAKEEIRELFNGKDLKGWKTEGKAKWTVENGVIKATGGDGWLISEQEFTNYELRVFAGKYKNGGTSGIYYNWISQTEPGFKTEFHDWGPTPRRGFDHTATNMHFKDYLLTQIINYGNESFVRNNGNLIQSNLFHNTVKGGKIAIFHSANDGDVRIPKIQIKSIDEGSK